MDWPKATARRDDNHFIFGFGASYIRDSTVLLFFIHGVLVYLGVTQIDFIARLPHEMCTQCFVVFPLSVFMRCITQELAQQT